MLSFNSSVLSSLVEEIDNNHRRLSKIWIENNDFDNLNLKTSRVDHLVNKKEMTIEPEFLNLVNDYHQFLYINTADIEFEYDYSQFDVRTRIKQKDSIVNKLFHYRNNGNIRGLGKVPINKCLNDIFGIRIVFEELNFGSSYFNSHITKLIDTYNLRIVNKRNEDYKATHLYFKSERNIYFPWELQLWSSRDAETNEKSHEEHADKRKYTEWPTVYHNSTMLERRDL